MDLQSIFEISGAGLDYQKKRLDVIAMNIANANTTRGVDGVVYRPLEVVNQGFNALVQDDFDAAVGNVAIVERTNATKLIFDPSHPDADSKGFVEVPNVNSIDEMTDLMVATRMYEANIQVVNAAKSMALKALEIGS
jgi:flagellar basal-body rod protein FlgC